MDNRARIQRRKVETDGIVLKFSTGKGVEAQEEKAEPPTVEAPSIAPKRSEIVEGLFAYGERPGLPNAPGRSEVRKSDDSSTLKEAVKKFNRKEL